MAEDITLFSSIASTRYASGRLFPPELFLDFIDRDLSLWTMPFDWGAEEQLVTSGATADFLYLPFPAAWPSDEGVSNLRMRLTVKFSIAAQLPGDTATFSITGGDQQNSQAGNTYTLHTFSRTWSPPFPTGLTTIQVTNDAGADPGKAQRSFGEGPDSFLSFLYTS